MDTFNRVQVVILDKATMTVADAVNYYLENRRGDIKHSTFYTYSSCARYIIGPLLIGPRGDRIRFGRKKSRSHRDQFLEMLGPTVVRELSTAQIRRWHKAVSDYVSISTANAAKKMLRASLAFSAEELHVAIPPMPVRFGRGRQKRPKLILCIGDVGRLLEAARHDEYMGIYYAFPFLTGVRISEQLALDWSDIDLEAQVITIRRMQEMNGSICNFTKTAASLREIPISPFLLELLIRWKSNCPTYDGRQGRVFPCLGRAGRISRNKETLSYRNYLMSYWVPALNSLGLPPVTPHSARHAFISNLQAQGIEVGLVAKLAGHASIAVTLSHYTQAVRGGEGAVRALEQAYRQGVHKDRLRSYD